MPEKADFDVEKALEGKGGFLPGRRIFVATTALTSSSLVLAGDKQKSAQIPVGGARNTGNSSDGPVGRI